MRLINTFELDNSIKNWKQCKSGYCLGYTEGRVCMIKPDGQKVQVIERVENSDAVVVFADVQKL